MYTPGPPQPLKWCMASESGLNSRNAFVYIRGSYSSKKPRNSRLALSPAATRAGRYRAAHLAECLSCRCTAERTNWIVRAQPEQTVSWPKHANASFSHGTLRLAPGGFERCHPVKFITGHGTIPITTSWRTISGIHHLRPASSRREGPKRRCACCAG